MISGYAEIFAILALTILALLVASVLWYLGRSRRTLRIPIPDPYRLRDSQEANWRREFSDEMQKADTLLELVCEAFCFPVEHRYQLAPNDRITDIYRACYPRWRFWNLGDAMEVEGLMFELDRRFGVTGENWHPNITLAELVQMMSPAASSDTR